jgi:Obg family GTPase CgtA-like protein
MKTVATSLAEMRETPPSVAEDEAPVVRPGGRPGNVTIHREERAYRVEGDRAVAFAEMMPIETDEGRAELWRRFGRWGVTGALKRAGAKPGNRVRLGKVELEMER